MIPEFTISGFLPPFLSDDPTILDAVAPYRVSLLEVAQRFATNAERQKILKGLVAYRAAIRSEGITTGFQWLDGSFVEACEINRGRPPKDIDIITFAFRPLQYNDKKDWQHFIATREDLFNPDVSKETYCCDAYFVDLSLHPIYLVNLTKYWYSLFSHQRETLLWKGMLEINIEEDDAQVVAFLNEVAYAS